MTPAQHYDAVVIGSGQGGNPLARALAQSGRATALVERVKRLKAIGNREG